MSRSRTLAWLAALLTTLLLSGCGYNQFQQLDEQVKAGEMPRMGTERQDGSGGVRPPAVGHALRRRVRG